MEVRVANCPSQDLALLNQLFISPGDFATLGGEAEKDLYLELKGFVYTAKAHKSVEPKSVGMNSMQRRNAAVSQGDAVMVAVFREQPPALLSSASLEANFVVKKAARGVETMDGAALVSSIISRFSQQYLTVGQLFVVDFHGQMLLIKVGPLEALEVAGKGGGEAAAQRGMLNPQTNLQLAKEQGATIQFTGLESQSRKTIFKQDFSFAEMGIGGLDKEFSDIFRRAFASRIFPASVVKKLGVNHVKGMLLYGPPGTGKTLIARQIGKMLNGKEPKIVNGPEVSHHDEAVHSSPAARAACGWPRRNGRVLDACALRRRRSASCARTPSRLMRSALSRLMRSHPTPSPRRRWCTGALQVRWSE